MSDSGSHISAGIGGAPGRRGLSVGPPDQIHWLEGVIKAVLVLNGLDAIFTLLWVRAGLATEANVLLARLVDSHPVAFVAVKLALVSGGSWLLWRHRGRAAAVVAIFAAFIVYYGILAYHIQYASTLVGYELWPEP